ncbi:MULTISPECIES: flavin reductase [unclassified Micromonospora]|uniref:flavin reductase n=1 Tax=unclassified Micromonospora TaxID=2617518 RepID=UPI001F0F5ADC|nr:MULTISPECIES: flavin reductase [unclassified Micromonospora]
MTELLPGRHTPLPPTWLCRIDAHPWPCGEAKLALLAAYADDRPGLLTLLSKLKEEAEDQLTQLDGGRPVDATDRFLTWACQAGR